jgi:hypothetical protein
VPPHGLEIANNYNYLSHSLIRLLHILIIVIGLVSNNFFPCHNTSVRFWFVPNCTPYLKLWTT